MEPEISCVWCGTVPKGKGRLTKEHLLPRSRGGSNSQVNIAWACSRCNSLRKSTPIVAFMQRRYRDTGLLPNVEAMQQALQRLATSTNGKEQQYAQRQQQRLADWYRQEQQWTAQQPL